MQRSPRIPALRRRLAQSADAQTRAEVAAELAYESALRPTPSGAPADRPEVIAWLREALAQTRGRDRSRVHALAARVLADPASGDDAAMEALAIAEERDDDALRFAAYASLAEVALACSRPSEALAAASRLLVLAPSLDDPDDRSRVEWYAAFATAACGMLDDARAHARAHDELRQALTPRAVVDALGLLALVHELAADWRSALALVPRLEQVAAAEADGSSPMAARALLVTALAAHHRGDGAESRRLEALADRLAPEGDTGLTIEGPRLRLMLARGETRAARPLLAADHWQSWAELAAPAARLDGLAAVGRADEVEAMAAPLLVPGSYLEPFALRALGVVRGTEGLVRRAAIAFDTLDLGRHAAETRALSVRWP